MKYNQLFAKWILLASFLGLCGCASDLLRSDFTNYSVIYGDESNKELLLNLARLANDDPVYYIQLGSISSQYQITTSLSFTGGNTRTTPNAETPGVQNGLALNGTANLGAVQTPIFSFIPLTGSNFVQAVLSPITPTVYLTFFDQGYPADLVVRTMVASIEWRHLKPDGTTNIQVLVNDPHDPSYGKFLYFCANLRNAQLSRMLTVSSVSSGITTNVIYGKDDRNPSLGDVVSAIAANISVTTDPHQNVIVSQATQKLELTPEQTLGTNQFAPYVNSQLDTNRLTYNTMPTSLKFGECNEIVTNFGGSATNFGGNIIYLKTRTFEAAMFSVAKQEVYYRDLETNTEANPDPQHMIYSYDNYGPFLIVSNLIDRSLLKVRPIMLTYYNYDNDLTASGMGNHNQSRDVDNNTIQNDGNYEPTLCSIPYHGKLYQITDVNGSDNPNQTVFTMLSYLFAQTAISTQNLPVQQLIQVQ